MESQIELLVFIFVIFGILQIVLFFKIWGMTNDVNAIAKHIIPQEKDLIKEIIKGNPDISNILFDAMYREMYNTIETGYAGVIKKYKAYYLKAGVKMPEAFEQIRSYGDWRKLNSCK